MTAQMATRRPDRIEISGDELKAAMKAVTMSSATLARILDVDKSTIYRWREGITDKKTGVFSWVITPLIWRACMSALGLPPDWQPGDPVPLRAVSGGGDDDVGDDDDN